MGAWLGYTKSTGNGGNPEFIAKTLTFGFPHEDCLTVGM